MNETLQTAAAEAVVTPAGQGRYVDLGDHRSRVAVSSRDSGGAFAMGITDVDYEGNVPPHVHAHEDETFYVLKGRFAVTVGGRAIKAGPGDTIFAPRNLPHTWCCISPGGGKLIILITPSANFEAFVMEMARRGSDPAADMADPARRAAYMALTERHGISMLPQVKPDRHLPFGRKEGAASN
jgi:quercetin dioxygenase-like cupin family protein